MSFKRKKALMNRFFVAVEQYLHGDDHAFATLLAPHFVDRVLTNGQEGIFITLQVIRESFSEAHLEVNDLVIAGEIVVANLTFDLCHTGTFMNIPPTNQRIRFTHVSALRVEGGMVVERLWYLSDALSVWRQLGVFTYTSGEVSL